MITLPRLAVGLLALLGAYVFTVAPNITTVPAASDWTESVPVPVVAQPPGPPAVFPATGKAFFGAFTERGPLDLTDVDNFAAAAGRQPQVTLFAQGWDMHGFDRRMFDKIINKGMLPMLGWEPWNYRRGSNDDGGPANQPKYRLAKIAAGDFDGYIRSWARGIQSLDYPVAIRFAHEMNGNWYPWAEQVNGNAAGEYVTAWKHVHDIFTAAGATNVIWVWSPNISYENSTPLVDLYPGDEYVDWVGLSGYYGTAGSTFYRTFDELFDDSIAEVQTITQRPIVLTEIGATDNDGRKAEWVRDLLKALPSRPEIIGFIWYEAVKETDWRIAASPEASQALATGLARGNYDAVWDPAAVPRLDYPPRAGVITPWKTSKLRDR